jgi:predicted aspartyl protease
MTTRFDPGQGLVVVRATIWGPLEITVARLALDTGATRSLLNKSILRVIGYDTTGMLARTQITTGSGVESTPLVVLSRIAALGKQKRKMAVICHTLPPTAGVDGLLGLDFMRGQTLSIDFRRGRVSLK